MEEPEQIRPNATELHSSAGAIHIRKRRKLPHWERESGYFFVTFRLADSLPRIALARIAERRQLLADIKKSGRKPSLEEQSLISEYSVRKMEDSLDGGLGACYLRNPQIAKIVMEALLFGDGKRYALRAWCIMPNHVHVIFRLLQNEKLAAILHGWKSYSSSASNKLLRINGAFWQKEYYDRLLRNDRELNRAILYVESNPIRAGLLDWPWLSSQSEERKEE